MDLATTTGVIHEATSADVRQALDDGLGAALVLNRNYGDWLRVEATASGRYRVAYYDASSNQRYRAAATWPLEQVKELVVDYHEGHWNWHQQATWEAF